MMTEKQKEAVELLNMIRDKKDSEGEYVMTPEQYLTLLEFIVDKPQEVYVPQVIPQVVPQWPLPGTTQPFYGPQYGQRWEITCKATE